MWRGPSCRHCVSFLEPGTRKQALVDIVCVRNKGATEGIQENTGPGGQIGHPKGTENKSSGMLLLSYSQDDLSVKLREADGKGPQPQTSS